jgi:hypothetical protein
MLDNLDDLIFHRLKALKNIIANKIRIAKFYNQKVQERRFSEGKLVWKVILTIKSKDRRFGKWSPNWEGPYRITRVAPVNAYFYETLEGEEYSRAINGKYFKKYYPIVWIDLL